MKQTKTVEIFRSECPYDNICQTRAKRLLFVCSVGMLRSPTCQVAATHLGFNARACGSSVNIALVPLSVNLINWAHHIIFMNQENFSEALDTFTTVDYHTDIIEKGVVWNIEDKYNWGDPELFNIVTEKLKAFK
jgi:predicted protein tyrosine phosphatase